MITAPVNKIIPFSSVDGPGNRTAVFFQGCNWDCCYCHNPETRNMCTGCMACVQVCPVGALQNENGKVHFFPERCVGCDTCIKTCRFGSSPRICNLTPEETFEQIKKHLNRMIEVIKVIDFTDVFVRMKEILYIKVFNCSKEDKVELFQIAETFKAKVIDYGKDSLLLEFVQTATKNDAVVKLIKEEFHRIEVVRGGSVGIESISMMER